MIMTRGLLGGIKKNVDGHKSHSYGYIGNLTQPSITR